MKLQKKKMGVLGFFCIFMSFALLFVLSISYFAATPASSVRCRI